MARTEAIASSLALHRLAAAVVVLLFKQPVLLKTLDLAVDQVAVAVAQAAAQATEAVQETLAETLADQAKTLATVAAVVVAALLLPVLLDLLRATAVPAPLHLSPVRP